MASRVKLLAAVRSTLSRPSTKVGVSNQRWQTYSVVTESKFEIVDGYTIVDVDSAARLVGPLRCAKKVLQRTTIDLVRHATYSCAVHGLDAAGAAAALNHDRGGDDQSPIAAFADELATWASENNFVGSAGLGVGPDEAGATLSAAAAQGQETVGASAAAAIASDANGVVIASDGDEPALQAALGDTHADIEADLSVALRSGADVVFVRGKTGVLDHATLDGTNVKLIVGLQPLTTTARGLAVAGRHDAVIVPDFITAAGPTLAALGHSTEDITTMTTTVMSALPDHGTGLFVAASEHAEAHLATMTDTLPFGRPLAP